MQPGADPQQIAMIFDGARAVCIDRDGSLVLEMEGGELRHLRPFAYQRAAGDALEAIPAEFEVAGNRVEFALGDYDRSRELVIDPKIVDMINVRVKAISTTDLTTDGAGNFFLVGEADFRSIPTTVGAPQSVSRSYDTFVMKVDSTGAILYATYLGGDGLDDSGEVVLDNSGNAHVVGVTLSNAYPVTDDAFKTELNGAFG